MIFETYRSMMELRD